MRGRAAPQGVRLVGHDDPGPQLPGPYGGHEACNATAHAQHIRLNGFLYHRTLPFVDSFEILDHRDPFIKRILYLGSKGRFLVGLSAENKSFLYQASFVYSIIFAACKTEKGISMRHFAAALTLTRNIG